MNNAKNIISALLCSSSIVVSMDRSDWQLHTTITHETRVNSAYFDTNGKLFGNKTLVTTADALKMYVYDANSGEMVYRMPHLGNILCIDSTGYLFTFPYQQTETGYIPYWSNEGPQVDGTFNSNLLIAPHRFSYHKSDTTAGTVARVIKKLLCIYDMNTNKDICSFEHENYIKDCCFHPRKNIIASITTPDTWVRIIDINTQKEILTLPSYKTYSHSIRFDETGNRLALTNTKTIDVLDISNLNHPQTVFSVQNTLNGTQACLNDKYLAVAFPEFIKLFNVDTKQEIATFVGNNDLSPMNCFDSTGNFMVILNGNNALVYKKTASSSNSSLAVIPTTHTNLDQDLDQDANYCICECIIPQGLKKSLASILVFFQNQLS